MDTLMPEPHCGTAQALETAIGVAENVFRTLPPSSPLPGSYDAVLGMSRRLVDATRYP